MKVSAELARDVMRSLEARLKSNFSLLEWEKREGDMKQLVYRIIFVAHPFRVELHEVVPGQQYAIVVLDGDKEELAIRKVWVMGRPSRPGRARGFCPASPQVFAQAPHVCDSCRRVESIELSQKGDDYIANVVGSILPVLRHALRAR